jgi:hypothetical protein
VIYDQWRRRIILHIARMDLQYVVALPQDRTAVKKPTIDAAVEIALARLQAYEMRGS